MSINSEHHLILAHEVTNQGHVRSQLANMAPQAQSVLDAQEVTVVANRGYCSGEEIKSCEEVGIKTYLPKPQTSGNKARNYFGKREFIYYPKDDEFQCLAGERSVYRFIRKEKGKMIRRYWSPACTHCAMKSQCTTGKNRRINRWEHESILDELEARINCDRIIAGWVITQSGPVTDSHGPA